MFKINNLTYKYDKNRKALDNVTMDFDKGDIIGIIGSNGSGKSTLIKLLLKELEPTEGEITVNGHVAMLEYLEPKKSGSSLLSKIFR